MDKIAFVLGECILPDGRRVGEAIVADPWIVDDLLTPAFAVEADKPKFALIYNELGRGSWKTGGAAAIALAEAVLEDGTDIVVAAGDTDQASFLMQALDGYLERNSGLGALATKRGNERLFAGGSRIRIISSDVASSWGHGGTHRRFRVICDELATWKDEDLWSALSSATGKTKNTQTLILSNAGFDRGHSWVWKVREAARTEPWGHLYSTPGIVASWVTQEWIDQQQVLLPATAFARVILNEWTTGSGDFITEEEWRRCVDERLSPGRPIKGARYRGGLDLGLVKDRSCLTIVHRSGAHIVLDEMTVWQGSRAEPVSITAIELAVISASRRYTTLKISCDPWQLRGSIERLQPRVNIEPFNFSATSVQHLSVALHSAITSQTLKVYPDAELEREVLALRVIESANGWRFDHRAGGYSDRAVALSMAILGVPPRPRVRGASPVGKGRIGDRADGSRRAGGSHRRITEMPPPAGLDVFLADSFATSEFAAARGKRRTAKPGPKRKRKPEPPKPPARPTPTDAVWEVLDEAKARDWPAIPGIVRGRIPWVRALLPVEGQSPPDLDTIRRDLHLVKTPRKPSRKVTFKT